MSLDVVFMECTFYSGLISQVAEELWEVKGRKIKNLTREDITIVDYKKMLAKNSEYTCFNLRAASIDNSFRLQRFGEGQAVQQDEREDQGQVVVYLAYPPDALRLRLTLEAARIVFIPPSSYPFTHDFSHIVILIAI